MCIGRVCVCVFMRIKVTCVCVPVSWRVCFYLSGEVILACVCVSMLAWLQTGFFLQLSRVPAPSSPLSNKLRLQSKVAILSAQGFVVFPVTCFAH